MNAAADYAAVRKVLEQPLPAYVSYVSESGGALGPFKGQETQHIVVRTSDGKVVSGKKSSVQIGAGTSYDGDVVTRPLFRPACYEATAAKTAEFEGKPVEVLSLKSTCPKEGDEENAFSTLYVDPRTHDPIAAVELHSDSHVYALLRQRFVRTGTRVLPSGVDVRVKGSGLLSWLDVTVHQIYSNFAFSDSPPPAPGKSPSP